MSRIEKLVMELCPDGVVHKELGDFASITRGGNFQKNDFAKTGVPCIHYGQIYTWYGLYTETTISYINIEVANKSKYASQNDIIMAVTSENVEDVCKSVAWLGSDNIAVSGHTAIIHHNQNPKYLSYYFHSRMFFDQKVKLAHGTKVIEVTPDKLKNITIPLPPLPVQREIVRILDNFTELTVELSAELSAELIARKKQYKFYCKLAFESMKGSTIVKIRDLGDWSGGGTPSMQKKEYWDKGTIPWISSKDMKAANLIDTQDHITEEATRNSSAKLLPKNTVAVVVRSGILKHTFPVAYVPFKAAINQDLKALVVKQGILPRYAYFAIFAYAEDILKKTKKAGGTVDSLDVQTFFNFQVPLVALEEQERIVAILDRFDTFVNDIAYDLPAEIEARRKQYNYYRDKLLTFKEAKS